jgi:plasmid stability protein
MVVWLCVGLRATTRATSSADSLERERRGLQTDLARLSRRGVIEFAANSGHNIHLEGPRMVVAAIRRLVDQARQTGPTR